MARPRVEIKPLRGLRVKQLCTELDITQAKLAEKTGISVQGISGMVNGKVNVTETSANAIHEAYPQYSFEWIMGYSEHKNEWDMFVTTLSKAKQEGAMLEAGIKLFADCNGFTITNPFNGLPKTQSVEIGITAIKKGYLISKEGKSINLSVEDMNHLINDISDYVEYRLDRYIKKGR